ncbi:MAG: thermonuclease family protein [Gammaproteobacteria bacterium]
MTAPASATAGKVVNTTGAALAVRVRHGWARPLVAILTLAGLLAFRAGAADFDSFAFVNDDGTLNIGTATIHLYGILIPQTDTTCYGFERPVPCGPRAILALKFDIGSNFVKCDVRSRKADGSYVAVCTAGDKNLAETLLRQGWAVALPDAPYRYKVLEKIAHAHGIGVWGIAVEPIHPRRREPHRPH